MQVNSTKKMRKILKPYVKNPKKMERLQEYINRQVFNTFDQSPNRKSVVKLDVSLPSKKRLRNEDVQNFDESSDSDISDYYYEDRSKAENYANTSLRNIYSKANSPQVPSTPTIVSDNQGLVSADNNSSLISKVHANRKNKKSKIKKKSTDNPDNIESKNKTFTFQTSLVKFSDVGGLNATLGEICRLLLHLRYPIFYKKLGVKTPPRGFLLYGPSGCGKTLIARAIAGQFELPFIEVAATELVSGISGESESKIRELFEGAINSAPCILFIDEIDAITPKRESAQKEMEKRIVTQLLKCMDDLNSKDAYSQVMVIGATNRPHSLDPALRRAGRFDREICIGVPDENARYEILEVVCNELCLSPEFDLHWLARNTPGYVGSDLLAIIREATNNAISRKLDQLVGVNLDSSPFSAISWLESQGEPTEEQLHDLFVEAQDFKTALRDYIPSAKREGFATIPEVTWADVGALEDIKKELQKAILWPVKYKNEFQKYRILPTTGVLLCGPKGCGKTLLAKAVANECSINFLSVKGPELLNMYVGESERAVRECFQRARHSAPCVIFFDEIDALCPARDSFNKNPVSETVVNQLLTEMDGIEGRKQIFIMGATNRPNSIDSAILRPGRLGKQIFVGVPNEIDRCNILQTITKNGTQPKLASDVCLVKLSCDARCQGFSGADLTSLVNEASMKAFEDHIAINHNSDVDFEVKLCHFDYAFGKVEPSNSAKDFFSFKQNRKKSSIEESAKSLKKEVASKEIQCLIYNP